MPFKNRGALNNERRRRHVEALKKEVSYDSPTV